MKIQSNSLFKPPSGGKAEQQGLVQEVSLPVCEAADLGEGNNKVPSYCVGFTQIYQNSPLAHIM